ncbi:MAG: glutamate racemase [Candidatus Saccharimonadales bacterium]
MKIGVFDSGIGGLSVAEAIKKALPEDEIIFVHDTPDHFPYATKSPDQIYGFVVPVLQGLIDQGCKAIVIACNTVSTTLRDRIRQRFDMPFVMLEPMVKPAAALTKNGVIAVCATPTTLASQRYAWLKATYGQACRIIEPDCADWSSLIEHNQMNEHRIRLGVEPALAAGADVIVLGCTHYHWIEKEVKAIVGDRAAVLQPETAVVAQLQRLLKQLER